MKFIHILPILALVTKSNSSTDRDICHKTSNEKCPWKNLKVKEKALSAFLKRGDREGTCEETCELCHVFDEATCRCSFVPCFRETSKLMASDKEQYNDFGIGVSISGNVAIIGASGDDDNGTVSGSAYVFEKDGSTGDWNEVAKLTASDGDAYDYFGRIVSISDNVAIVGAFWDEDNGLYSGSAYVFEKDGSTGDWNEVAKLTASDGDASDQFGGSVSISGNVAIVGADGNCSAYVFEKDALIGDWNEVAKLTASEGDGSDYFGFSVSVSGNVAIVGAHFDDDNGSHSGSAYVFEKDGSTGDWNEVAKLTASDGDVSDQFGGSVSISGNVAIVGADGDDDSGSLSGSAYVFEKDASIGNWNEVAKLTASDGYDGDGFGYGVSISGNVAVVGAPYDDDDGLSSGSAYVFVKDDSTGLWYETAKLTASDGAEAAFFGYWGVSVSGTTVIVGAHGDNDDGNGYFTGSAYVFESALRP